MRRFWKKVRGKSENGMVLVIMLAMIVLVTIAVMAFFTRATANRKVASSLSNQVKAELLAKSGVDYASSLLLEEIESGANSLPTLIDGVTTYRPLTNNNAIPERLISTAIQATDTNFFNLIRQSLPGTDPRASSSFTFENSRNGRSITSSRWNAPKLLSGSGFGATNQLPAWIYVTSKGGLTNAPDTDVIGRFAYNIYDLGGLLDANVAGYDPSVVPATNVSRLKASVAGADLEQLPGMSAGAVSELVNFRNAGAVDSAESYEERVKASARRGFLQTVVTNFSAPNVTYTNNQFTSRQDLLRYARTQNTALTNALPYLTHFSRSVKAPTWKPATITTENPDLMSVRFQVDATVTHYTDEGEKETYSVRAGDPFLQRQFSLAKLAWITKDGPLPGIPDEAIQACFGLKWRWSDLGEERWDYVGPTGETTLTEIDTLENLAGEKLSDAREPNFFEMLKAGLVTGSLGSAAVGVTAGPGGTTSTSACTADTVDIDGVKDLHVLRIGANMIDCADGDNFPTILGLKFGSITLERAGVEDLPYFFTLDLANYRKMTTTNVVDAQGKSRMLAVFTNSDFVWVPELMSLHRTSSPTSQPGSLKIKIVSGDLINIGYGENGPVSGLRLQAAPQKDLTVLPEITVPPGASAEGPWEAYRNGPSAVRDPNATNRVENFSAIAVPTESDVTGFHVFSHGNTEDYAPGLPATLSDAGSKIAVIEVNHLIIALQYETPRGRMKTYITLGGEEALPTVTGIGGVYRDDFNFFCFKHSNSISNQKDMLAVNSPYIAPWDPRSNRLGPAFGRYSRPLAQAPQFVASTSNFVVTPKPFYPDSYLSFQTNPKTGFLGNMPQYAMFHDPDYSTVGMRLPDGNIGFTLPGSKRTTGNPYGNLAVQDARPVILQRPYQTVAELGYVSRDTPWQTLNFYNQLSGDSALLDLFSVTDSPGVTAGEVSLNMRYAPVRQALFSGTGQVTGGGMPLNTTTVAAALGSYTFTEDKPTDTAFLNKAGLAPFMDSQQITDAALSAIKYRREAVVRALDATQTRTWNVFIDVIAQVGSFPGGNVTSENFVVTAEERLWTSAAIDRYTKMFVDRVTENPNE